MSSVWWEDTRISHPSPSSDSSSRKRSRCSGSSPAVGSSRISSRGSPSSACAKREPAAHAARQRADALATDVLQADPCEHAPDFVMASAASGVLLEDRDVVEVLEGREARVEAGLLRHVAEPAPDLRALHGIVWVTPQQAHVALVVREHGGEDAHQRRLARAVGAEQAGDPAVETEVHPLQRLRRAQPLGHTACAGHRTLQPSRHSWRSASTSPAAATTTANTSCTVPSNAASASPGRTAPAIAAASQIPETVANAVVCVT